MSGGGRGMRTAGSEAQASGAHSLYNCHGGRCSRAMEELGSEWLGVRGEKRPHSLVYERFSCGDVGSRAKRAPFGPMYGGDAPGPQTGGFVPLSYLFLRPPYTRRRFVDHSRRWVRWVHVKVVCPSGAIV